MDQFLTPEEWNIDNLFKGKYIIPIYQRPYSWGENEVKQLLKDIYSSYQLFIASQSGDTSVKNEEMLLFTGTLFIKTNRNVKNEYTEYDIVDGQQRTTTLTLVLMILLNILTKIDSDDDSVKEIKNYLWKKVDRKNNKDARVLTLGNIDQPIMIELFDNLFSGKDIVQFANNKLEEKLNDVEKNLLKNVVYIANYFDQFENENFHFQIDQNNLLYKQHFLINSSQHHLTFLQVYCLQIEQYLFQRINYRTIQSLLADQYCLVLVLLHLCCFFYLLSSKDSF